MNYTNREVVRRLKQYDMFLNSLNLTMDEVQKERIFDQLDKIEKQILLETNNEYEEAYMVLLGEETRFFSEEKERLYKLISLISDRKKYLEDRKNRHRNITGSLVELTTFLGEDKLTTFKNRLSIIEKYEENKVRQENIIKDMKKLDLKLSEASRAVKANNRLNDILENKMKEVVSKALDKLNLYVLTGKREEIFRNYQNYEYARNLAENNLKTANEIKDETTILECEEMLAEINGHYNVYNEKLNILNLIDIYENNVNGYEELLEKREQINEILKNISNNPLYDEIIGELSKEYNTIKLEKQDIDNYESLKKERERKNRTLYELDEENNSKEFKLVIDEFVKNENRVREEKIRTAKTVEYQERQKKILEEQKIEAARVKRQKLIEEARLKEQQERLERVKELQEKTVINIEKEEKINTKKNEEPLEIKNNPLKDKTFEEVVSLNNNFDTDELFENTKIVPNKVKDTNSLIEKINAKEEIENNKINEEISLPVWDEPISNNESISTEEIEDLFKEIPAVTEVQLTAPETVEITETEIKNDKPSIYDILENNQNIIWKTTDTEISKNIIPVIGNNNLKPEILDNRKVESTKFPKLDSKEGDILWKETL